MNSTASQDDVCKLSALRTQREVSLCAGVWIPIGNVRPFHVGGSVVKVGQWDVFGKNVKVIVEVGALASGWHRIDRNPILLDRIHGEINVR